MIYRILLFLVLLSGFYRVNAQTPVPMASLPGLTYTEDFADIANWTNGFASGIGANRFGGLPAGGSGTIPNGTNIVHSTLVFQTTGSTVGGVHRGNEGIVLLATGAASENSNSTAIDFFMDYTGVTAGTLSFDWNVVFNSTGNRKGSLHVYSSTDGTTFTELTAAAVLNFTNNVAGSGNVVNVSLASTGFTNNPNARLRFYYNNGNGGTTGNRPKINIDNLKVTATGIVCSTPASQPTGLVFSNITSSSADGSFTAAAGSPSANEYVVVASNNSTLTSGPVDGTTYNAGDGLGDGVVVYRGAATTFSAPNLSSSSHYYFFIFSERSFCTGGPIYLSSTPLVNDVTTLQGLPDCVAPVDQPSSLTLTPSSPNIIQGSFNNSSGSGYLIIRSVAALNTVPVTGHAYITGEAIGNGIIVQSSINNSFSAGGLSPNSAYNFYVFSYNAQNCLNGPAYNTVAPLTGSAATPPLQPCATPPAQPTALQLSASRNAVFASFVNAGGADYYLVLQSTDPLFAGTPTDNTDYNVGNNISGGTVVYAGPGGSGFLSGGLAPATTYYYFVFAADKNCSGGTKYLAASPLTGNTTTTNDAVTNVYFGNWHSHSDYSDGNKDNPAFTPADDYNYAMGSQCMDYLGISEHNHYTASNNPGNKIANYHTGTAQADAFTSSNPNFIAMYGMEWGVISNGGHVVIYGDAMNQLFGWETGSGLWGPSNNYDVFVAKSDYTGAAGLFKTVFDRRSQYTFATLAHPNSSDFNNIAGTAYNAIADSAIVGSAIETGPAFSTNTTYTEPGSSLSLLPYYQSLLAKGYHLGPVIDHDNHNTTFGRTAKTRTAVVAPALSKTELIKGMYRMHFYATQDCDTKIDFTVNAKPMGTVFSDRFAPVIAASLSDATTSLAGAVINLMYGAPGSGILPTKIFTATGSSLSYTDQSLANNATGYYYLEITNGSSHMVTSPVWYTRVDGILPVRLTDFNARAVNDRVQLTWATEQEISSKYFIVQHSADGRHWTDISTVAAAGFSAVHLDYMTYDLNPFAGINYYRLQQTDLDGKTAYSDIRRVNIENLVAVNVSPNPARDLIRVSYKNNNRRVMLQLISTTGTVMYTTATSSELNIIPVKNLAKGMYFLKMSDAEKMKVVRVMVD